MCAPMFLSSHIPVPPLVTVPIVTWTLVPHCNALHVSVIQTCVHLPLSTCE